MDSDLIVHDIPPDESIKVTAVTRLKHAELLAAAARLGGQKQLSDYLNVNIGTIGHWVTMRSAPPKEPNRTWDWERITDLGFKLKELTGKSPDELFPDNYIKLIKYNRRGITIEKTEDVPLIALHSYALETTCRMERIANTFVSVDNLDEAKVFIRKAMSILSPREKMVVSLRYGITGETPMSLSQVGKKMGCTSEGVRHIESKAIDKIRRRCEREDLSDTAAEMRRMGCSRDEKKNANATTELEAQANEPQTTETQEKE